MAGLLVAGAISLVIVPAPGSFAIALPVMVVTFLLGGARLARDLVELDGVALAQIPVGNSGLTEILFVAGAATQALPRGLVLLIRSRRTS
jgi:hypothetical protein